MIPAKQGVIICTASTLGILPDQPTNYAISKAAVIAAVRSAAADLGQYGIRVNCISPTVVATPLPLRYLRALQPNFNLRHNLVLDGGSTTRKANFWRIPTHDSKI
ncbi:unnamed protein product [Sphagnum troendelagicum]|uniref:Uncharacterized protein n=1 Tax=Sphagnum troendelagicum TaxID=128251 RepID=A0ABP0U5C7_9BRYO